jgi:DNA-binding NarL/FixJ family response regulator
VNERTPTVLLPEPVKVWVLSPYPSVRAGLRVLLAEDARCRVVGDSPELPAGPVEVSGAASLDVLVVDLPTNEALDDFLAEAERLPAPGIVLLGTPPDDHHTLAQLGPRPWGFLPREADGETLATAVQTVYAGLLAIDPNIAAHLFAVAVPRLPGPLVEGDGYEDLTPREVEVLSLLAEGIPNKAIARRLAISEHTVKFHVGSVLGKLNAASRTEAVRNGARRGLIAL